jgi:hypothetical protein
VSRPLLDLVQERVDHGLSVARGIPLAGHLGLWLGVVDDPVSWEVPDGLPSYGDVAAAGMVFAARGDGAARSSFEAGIAWLQERRFFVPGQPASLEADPLALVGIACGIDALNAATGVRGWFLGLVEKALARETDSRRAELLRLALVVAQTRAGHHEGVALSAVVQAALSRRLSLPLLPDACREARSAILSPIPLEPEWAVLHAAALEALFALEAAIDIGHVTVGQVADLLRRVPAALKRWPWEDKPKTQGKTVTAQRWDIQHEYHVQSLLWAVLRPVFPALEDEENLPSLGHKHPRADLLVPGLRLVIEVKYLREASQSARAKIIEEVAADAGLYLTDDSAYDRIVAFIWDATASTNHHDELIAGIRSIKGIADAVVVSRPGDWKQGGAA